MKKQQTRSIDWDAIETAYETGNESQRALAARLGVSVSDLSKRCKDGGWVKKRAEFRRISSANAWQKALRAREEEIVEGLQATDLVNKRVMEVLRAANCLEVLVETKQPLRELESASKVLINTEEARRLLRGIMKPVEYEKAKLEREKWEHELKRETEEETGKGNVRVEFESEEMEEFSE